MKTFLPGQVAVAADVNANFTELSNTTAALDTAVKAQASICPNARFKAAPSGTPLRPFAYYLNVNTNQYGQTVINFAGELNGIVNCVVQPCPLDTSDPAAFADVAVITGVESSTGKPIVTLTRGGARRANVSTYVSIVGIGW